MNNVGSLSEMVNSSIVVLTKPRVSTFEMFERRGNVQSALVYVGIASVISGILTAIGPHGGLMGLLGGLITALIGFLVFTGAVFYIGRSQGGTGTFDEVAYTFSLFWAPIAVIGGVIGLLARIPILGCIVGLPLSLALVVAEVYFGFLAVQSSMNLIDRTKAIVTLILAAVVSIVFSVVMAVIF
jgi:hypothetical protein